MKNKGSSKGSSQVSLLGFYQKYLPSFYQEQQKEAAEKDPKEYGTGLAAMLIEHARKKLAETAS